MIRSIFIPLKKRDSQTGLVIKITKESTKNQPNISNDKERLDQNEIKNHHQNNDHSSFIYDYPPVSDSIVQNISNALINCPKFYVQVLNLMNEMNLPLPFNPNESIDERNRSFNCFQMNRSSATESIESDANKGNRESILIDESKKRRIKSSIEEATKKLKIKNRIASPLPSPQPSIQSDEIINDYFDEYVDLRNNRISCKLNLNGVNNLNAHKTIGDCGSIVNDFNKSKNDQNKQNSNRTGQSVKIDHLFERQLKIDELKNYSIFKNYSINDPNSRLYIKNVDKKVTEDQLRSIFIGLMNLDDDLESNKFEINLMKKGKMNGQAFVCFSNEQIAREAINRTNGLLINKKPIYVCFAKSMKTKENG